MTNEEKQLLLHDLCARLPYGIAGLYTWKCKKSYNRELSGNLYDELCSSWSSTEDSQFLPYLRPMSSMTGEELNEYRSYCRYHNIKGTVVYEDTYKSFDWLNKNGFDYRGLIKQGLALEAPEGMYNN